MSRDPAELDAQIKAAKGLPDSLAKVERLRELTRRAEAEGLTDASIEANLSLVEALKGSPEPGHRDTNQRYIAQFARCVSLHKAHRERFDDAQYTRLWKSFFWVALKFLEDDPTLVPAAQARALLTDMADHCPPQWTHELHRLTMKLEMRAGDLEAAERCERLLRSAASYDIDRSHEAVSLGLMWATVGRHEDAVRVLRTYALGEGIDDFSLDWAHPSEAHGQLAMSYLALGRTAEARAAHEAGTDRDTIRLGFLPVHLMYCAATGAIERGLALMHGHIHYLCSNYVGLEATRLKAAAAVLIRRAIEQGRGAESWELPEDASAHGPLEKCGGGEEWIYDHFFHRLLDRAQTYAVEMDESHDTRCHIDLVHAILHAPPSTPVEAPRDRWHRDPPAPPVIDGDPAAALAAATALEDPADRGHALWRHLNAAEAAGFTATAFDARLALATTLTARTWSASVATQLAAVAEGLAAQAPRLDRDRREACGPVLDRANARLVDELGAFVPVARVRALLEASARLPGADPLQAYALRIRLEANANRAETVTELWTRAARAPWATEAVPVAAGRAFAELGRHEAAIELLAPRIGTGGVRADDLLASYLRTGRRDEADRAHESTWDAGGMDDTRLLGHLLHCLGAGATERARTLLHANLVRYELPPGDPRSARNHAASVRLATVLTEAGAGEETWLWHDAEPGGEGPYEWTYRTYAEEVGADAAKRVVRLDLCYGTDRLRDEYKAVVDGEW
ncbi:hypothetical protein [Glycomyces paridis]|uniref:Tetratricopeptide repeat protein n=1 Tax=Glycomyces paridis TaxID=2126555 RepID=A0A4S8PEN6_9ACTN|nr:hypothetical protein [Glycomyces paridis]THV28065.1 hypothetical protein E9998_13895 [Glycomyces paridis]